MKYYVGIDCGMDGAIVVLDRDGGIVRTMRMPTMNKGKGKKIDLLNLWMEICIPTGVPEEYRRKITFGVEDPGPHAPSAAGLRGMTYSFAAVEMALVVARHRTALYSAKEWQGTFWKRPKMAKGQKFDTKAAALVAAKRLWPDETFLASSRCTVPHDGIVDALLIAEHCRREFK